MTWKVYLKGRFFYGVVLLFLLSQMEKGVDWEGVTLDSILNC